MIPEIAPENLQLLGGGNDDLGLIQLIENESVIELTASSMSSRYLKYVIVLGVGVFFFFSVAFSDPNSHMLSLQGLLFFSPVFIAILAMLAFSDWYTRHRESNLLPLLCFDGSLLVQVRGKVVRKDCGTIELYLIHANNSPHGEIVELQMHEHGLSLTRFLVLSVQPGSTQHVMREHLSRIVESKKVCAYFVKTDGPQGKRPLTVKSIERLTEVTSN